MYAITPILKSYFYRLDIDECKRGNVCPVNSYCINTEGSFRCSCDVGYTGSASTTGTTQCSRMLH